MLKDYENNNPQALELTSGEIIHWQGKPKKNGFIFTKSVAFLPIAIVWLCLDLEIIISSIIEGEFLLFIIPFFTLHLMPVWIWLGNLISARSRWKNTTYYITNKRIVFQGGFFAVNETSLFFKEINNVNHQIGLFNKVFHSGNISFDSFGDKTNVFEHLENAKEVYNLVQPMIYNLQRDTEFPNDLRPQ
ncbi:MAG: PH domain-containing protein [Clostridia bacterium]|nr:PH domain-containing protein [Clostridia bacterium]